MANVLRHLRGYELDVRAFVESATIIEVGDLVYTYTSADVRYIRPASSFTWDTDLLTTQKGYKLVHLGVAKQASAVGETQMVLVDASPLATFRFDCAAAKFTQMDMIAPAKAAGDALEKQVVVETDNAAAAIFRVSENFQAANVTVVNVINQASSLFDDLSDAASGE